MSLKDTLFGMIDSGRVPHAIMFSEHDGGGAVGLCLEFLEYLYCTDRSAGNPCGKCPSCNKIAKLIHPDVHFVFPATASPTCINYISEWRSLVLSNPRFTESQLNDALGLDRKSTVIGVAEAKELLSKLSLSALEGGYRSVIIYLPEKLHDNAANRLLKLIEEPPAMTIFLFISHAPEKVLSTISSRCQRFQLNADALAMNVDFAEPDLLDKLMNALIARDLNAALDAGDALSAVNSREIAKSFCRYASAMMRSIFLLQQGLPAGAGDNDEVRRWASSCKKTFPRKALESFDRAYSLIDRNVNLKIIFTDLVDRLYLNI